MQNESQGSVIALGMFDGVHLGHRVLLRETAALAEEMGASPLIYTFQNHPLALFGREPRLLMTPAERIAALAGTGIPVEAAPFTARYAATPPRRFIEMLLRRFSMRGVVVGFNYTFGDRGAGNTALLRSLGEELGFTVKVIDPVICHDAAVSSTRIRASLEEGRLADTNEMLGDRYVLSGTVEGNRRIGHAIGYPTANLTGYGNKVLPLTGVYATRAYVDGSGYDAVTNVGNNPTVEGRITTVETHLLDFDADIYGAPLRVEFVERLRGEIRFEDREALARQITADVEHAKEILKKQAN